MILRRGVVSVGLDSIVGHFCRGNPPVVALVRVDTGRWAGTGACPYSSSRCSSQSLNVQWVVQINDSLVSYQITDLIFPPCLFISTADCSGEVQQVLDLVLTSVAAVGAIPCGCPRWGNPRGIPQQKMSDNKNQGPDFNNAGKDG
jgi:hypothetical protein